MINQDTQGALDLPDEAFVNSSTEKSPPTSTSEDTKKKEVSSQWTDKIKDLSTVVLSFSQNVRFAGLLVATIGYIVISSFGGLKSIGEFWRYIIFLGLAFSVYTLLSIKNDFKEIKIKTRIYISLTLLLLVLLIISNWELITYIFSTINKKL
jgi:hypothetical protein